MKKQNRNVSLELTDKLDGQFRVLVTLVNRHLKMFFKNKMTFFFSLLVPAITLIIYILFLRDLELQGVEGELNKYFTVEQLAAMNLTQLTSGIIDSWMLSGIIAISCISVSFNCCYIIVNDRETSVNRDFISSPISRPIIRLSYFLFNIIVTTIITIILLIFCLIYLSTMNSFYISTADFFIVLGLIIFSNISASCFTILISSMVTTNASFNSIIATSSASIGFLIGGYMPIGMLPAGIQNLCMFFPGTYSASILRTFFLRGQIDTLETIVNQSGNTNAESLISSLKNQFLNLHFFSYEVDSTSMVYGFLLTTVVLVILNIVLDGYFENCALGEHSRRSRKNRKVAK